MDTDTMLPRIAEEDVLRAHVYDTLAALLSRPADATLIARCAALKGDDTPLGRGFGALAAVARQATPASVTREFNALFIGLGRGELVPYASYYMTGFLNEKPLAAVRRTMAARGMRRSDGVFEPEDNIATLCEMMAGLILGRFGAAAGLEAQRDVFNTHLAPWAPHFFTDLEGAKTSLFYAPVGAIGRTFLEIEREAFRLGA